MTGINILAEYTAGGTPVGGTVVFAVLAVLGLIIFLAGCVCGDDDVPGAGCIVIVVSLAMLFFFDQFHGGTRIHPLQGHNLR